MSREFIRLLSVYTSQGSLESKERGEPKKSDFAACSQCSTCLFRPDGIKLEPETLMNIQIYLLQGTNHFCHSDESNEIICLGGRQFQLEMWYRLGILKEATNEALRASTAEKGFEAKGQILNPS